MIAAVPLCSITVGGYQSYREPVTVTLDERLTFIAGQNDVGKSALLRVIRAFMPLGPNAALALLLGARGDFHLSQTWVVPSNELAQAGGAGRIEADTYLADLARNECQTINVTFGSAVQIDGTLNPTSLQIVSAELVDLGSTMSAEPNQRVQWNGGALHGSIAQPDTGPLGVVRTLCGEVTYVGPRTIPEGRQQLGSDDVLRADASNLVSVLSRLLLEEDPLIEEINGVMRGAFPHFRRVRVSSSGAPLQGQIVITYEHSAEPVPLEDAGSGVAQLLALTTAVLTSPSRRLFLIDEPQAFLHPKAEGSLLALLDQNENHQYVVATHSHYLLSSRPLSQSRLLSLNDAGSTRVIDATRDALLDELGITAADLWLHDRILWVEGETEMAVYAEIRDAMDAVDADAIAINKMPLGADQFTGRARNAFRFVEEVIEATRDASMPMRFVFDRDEKTPDQIERLETASSGRADFPRRREIENYFLDPDLIHAALERVTAEVDRERPTLEAISESLSGCLAATNDEGLFPRGLEDGEQAVDVIRGSEVMRRLWWDYAIAEYDKPRDGAALARIALETNPDLVNELRAVLEKIAARP
jgi:energy-coupling factor transporter ATP-binding protein EcfA2